MTFLKKNHKKHIILLYAVMMDAVWIVIDY